MYTIAGMEYMDIDLNNMEWPDHFPSECPPSTATSAPSLVFRFTNRITPNKRDFFSHYEINLKKYEAGKVESLENWGRKACKARGLSVYANLIEAKEAQDLNPSMRKKKIAEVNLSAFTGARIEANGTYSNPNHHTLWHPKQDQLFLTCTAINK